MKRLTEEIRNYDGTGVSKKPIYVLENGGVSLTDYASYILTQLADYEDTGITPKEVEELKERDTEKTAIITGYNRAVGCKVGECPKCGAMARDYMNFCDECGQRLRWEE